MSKKSKQSPSARQVADDGYSSQRIRLIGELIVCEAERLADVCQRTKSIEPLLRMGWILQDAMEQVYNQLGYLKHSLHISDKEADQNGGQGDE